MKNKKYSAIVFIISFIQLLIWGLYTFITEYIFDILSLISGIIFILTCTIIYFVIEYYYIKKTNISKIKYNVISLISWNVINIIFVIIINFLIRKDIIAHCYGGWMECAFSGVQYYFFFFSVVAVSLLILILKIFYFIYKKIKNKSK